MEGLSLHHRFLDEAEEANCRLESESHGAPRGAPEAKHTQSTVMKRALIENSGAAGSKWSRGKGRQVLQYGVFYDYAQHRIDPDQEVELLPPVLLTLIELLVGEVLPASKRPTVQSSISTAGLHPAAHRPPLLRAPVLRAIVGFEATSSGKGIATVGPGEFAAPSRPPSRSAPSSFRRNCREQGATHPGGGDSADLDHLRRCHQRPRQARPQVIAYAQVTQNYPSGSTAFCVLSSSASTRARASSSSHSTRARRRRAVEAHGPHAVSSQNAPLPPRRRRRRRLAAAAAVSTWP